jgi:hypothetical protein
MRKRIIADKSCFWLSRCSRPCRLAVALLLSGLLPLLSRGKADLPITAAAKRQQ